MNEETIKMGRCICGGHPMLIPVSNGFVGRCNRCGLMAGKSKTNPVVAANAWNRMIANRGDGKVVFSIDEYI